MGQRTDTIVQKYAITDPELRRFLQRRLARIQRLYQPSRLLFFGSRATGKANAYSDIDLVIVSEHFRGKRFLDRLTDFIFQMEWDSNIDALCYTPEEFEEKLRLPTIVQEAVKEGKIVI